MESDIMHSLLDSLSAQDGTLKISSLIVHYLSKHFASEYEWDEIENLLKMFVIFGESISKHGDIFFLNSENSQWLSKNAFNILYNEQTNSINFEIITKNILKTPSSMKSAIILDHILSYVKKNLDINMPLNAFSHQVENVNVNKKKLYALIERVFGLPSAEIENSIEIVVKNFDFEILGHLFCETSGSIYFDKCTIISDIICKKIENSTKSVNDYFMPSLLLSLKSKTGKSLFKKCLQNRQFSTSLNLFLKTYFKNFEQSLGSTHHQYEQPLFNQMSFLMYLNCSEMDNSDLDIFKELNEKNFFQEYLTNINLMYG